MTAGSLLAAGPSRSGSSSFSAPPPSPLQDRQRWAGAQHATLFPRETSSFQLTNLTVDAEESLLLNPSNFYPRSTEWDVQELPRDEKSSWGAPSAALDGKLVFVQHSKTRISFSPLGYNPPELWVTPGLTFPDIAADRATTQGPRGL